MKSFILNHNLRESRDVKPPKFGFERGLDAIYLKSPISSRERYLQLIPGARLKENDIISDGFITLTNNNLLKIHEYIIYLLESEADNVSSLIIQRNNLEALAKGSKYIWEVIEAERNCVNLQEVIREAESTFRLIDYLRASEEIIKRYEDYMNKPYVIDIYSSESADKFQKSAREASNNELKRIISDYCDVISGITNVKICRDQIQGDLSFECSRCGTKEAPDNNNGMIQCVECGKMQSQQETGVSHKDNERVNKIKKNAYISEKNFMETINHFQGSMKNKSPRDIIKLIRRYMLRDSVDATVLTRDHIHGWLKEAKKPQFYKYKQSIFSEITGKQPPNIDNLVSSLKMNCQKVDKEYPNVKLEHMKSALNRKYLLYKLLQEEGFPIEKVDLDLHKRDPDKLELYDQIYFKICDNVGMKKIPT
jgi:uncharacterized Zn finger protein (UPF0148 family)